MFPNFVAAAFILERIFLVYAVGTNTSVAPSCTSKPAPIRFAIIVPLAVNLRRFIFLAAIEAYISNITDIKPESIRDFRLLHHQKPTYLTH
jgi:hypothetical protein